MNKSTNILIILLLLLTLLFALPAKADDAASTRPIRIGYMDYGAFIEEEDDGNFSGFGVEFLEEISRYTGWTYEYVYDTWPNLLERVKNKEIDFLGTPQKTPEREEIYDFADISSGFEQTIIYTRADNDEICYNDFEAMDGKRVALLSGSFQTAFFTNYAQKHNFSFVPYFFDSDDEAKEALKAGRVDLMAGGSLAMNTDLKVVGKEGADPFYWMTYKDNEEMLGALNDAMEQITNNNPYFSYSLMQKYYGSSVVMSQPQFTRKQKDYISTHKNIRVGCYEDSYPISRFNEKTGEAEGILVDIMNMLAENAGITVTYIPVSLSDNPETGLLNGDYEVFLPGTKTGYQANSLQTYSRPYFTDTMIPVLKKGNVFSTDRSDYTAALITGYSIASNLLSKLLPSYSSAFYSSNDECLMAVRNGDADLAFTDVYEASYELRSPYFTGLEEDFGHTVDNEYVLSTLRNNHTLIDVFDSCIQAIDQGKIDDIVAVHTYASNYQYTLKEWVYENRGLLLSAAVIFVITIAFLSILLHIQRKAVRQMAEKNSELEIANRARTTFLSNMSHEIRTPLNGIKGTLDILLNDDSLDDKTMHLLSMSAISADHLSNLVNDILDMSKLENGKLDLRNAYFATEPFVENICEIVEPLALKKNLEFHTHLDGNTCRAIYADRSRLAQVCINLLSNSIKYTEEGGRVDFTFSTVKKDSVNAELTIIIEDTGIGMSEEFLEKAFEPFVQETTSDTRNGTGLGLSITNALVNAMNGVLVIESELGHGTKASVTITAAWDDYVPSAPQVAAQSAEGQPQKLPAAGMHLLLAEDNDINREIACIQARRFGFEVDTAGDGEEAVALFEKSAPGYYRIILMDIMMPKIDGLEAAKRIRSLARPDSESVYIVAMTANAYAEDIDRSMKSGMNTHLSKPFRQEDLMRIFNETLQN